MAIPQLSSATLTDVETLKAKIEKLEKGTELKIPVSLESLTSGKRSRKEKEIEYHPSGTIDYEDWTTVTKPFSKKSKIDEGNAYIILTKETILEVLKRITKKKSKKDMVGILLSNINIFNVKVSETSKHIGI